MKVSELQGAELDRWAAKAEGISCQRDAFDVPRWKRDDGTLLWIANEEFYSPSTKWEHGGPIIERELIELSNDRDWREDGEFGRVWEAHDAGAGYYHGDTPLIAAMRAYVASKLGPEVPDVKEPQ